MHELGIVKHVIQSVSDIATENGISRLSRVKLSVGEVSGVINDLLADCWEWYCQKSPLMDGCRLETEVLEAVTYCTACEKEYGTVKYGRTCPFCGSGETYLLRGSECVIKEIEAE